MCIEVSYRRIEEVRYRCFYCLHDLSLYLYERESHKKMLLL
jgi:hypothetical protein